jgi:hypothetical protein
MPRRAKSNGGKEADGESAALRMQAREGAGDAMAALLKLTADAQSESVKLAAIKELLDRGFGRVAAADQAGAVIAHLMVEDGYES